MKKALSIVAVLITLQALLGGMWWWVERGREVDLGPASEQVWEEDLDIPLPALAFDYADGRRGDLSLYRGRPFILHIWATWCPPCREELPGLLDYANSNKGHAVVALSVDESWESIRTMMGSELDPALGKVPSKEVTTALGVSNLPVTFLVDEAGVIRLRVDGPVNWRSPSELSRMGKSLGGGG